MGCVKLGEKNCIHLPSVGEQIANYTKYGHSGTDTVGRYQNDGAGTGTLDIKVLSQVGHLPAHLKLIQLGAG